MRNLFSTLRALMALLFLCTATSVWGEDVTGTITFGTNATKIDAASVTGKDTQNNTWTITTEGTTSFTQNTSYSQVGSKSSSATIITFTTTLPAEQTITAFSAKFGGFSSTAGTVTLKVGETEVGSGSLNETTDVIATNTSSATGKTLTVTVTGISKGVKCYNISYTYSTESGSDTDTDTDTDIANTKETAYTVAQAVALIDAGKDLSTQVYVKGIVSKISSSKVATDGTLNYFISDDGELTSQQFELYKNKNIGNVSWENVSDVTVGDQVIAYGTLQLYYSTYEMDAGNYLVEHTAYEAPTLQSIAITGELTTTTYTENTAFSTDGLTVTGTYSDASTKDVTSSATLTANPSTLSTVGENIKVTVTATVDGVADATKDFSVTVTALPKYTVTFDAGTGTCATTSITQESYGASIELPSTCTGIEGWDFEGWSTAAISATSSKPTLVSSPYTPTEDITLYAVYKKTTGSGEEQWKKVNLADYNNEEGTFALLTTDYHAFNGDNTDGDGQVTGTAFTFGDDGYATSVPSDVCELTFTQYSEDGTVLGVQVFNALTEKYLYIQDDNPVSRGHLAWHRSESSYWKTVKNNSTYYWQYSSNSGYLNSYQNTTFRTYGSSSLGSPIVLAQKTGGTSTTYNSNPESEGLVTSIAITNPPSKVDYKTTEKFSKSGMVVTATYSNGKTAEISGYTVEPADDLTVNDTQVTVKYGSCTATQDITVGELSYIEITSPSQTKYTVNDSFNPASMVVKATWSNGITEYVTKYSYTPNGKLTTSDTQVVISYTWDGVTVTTPISITVSAYPTYSVTFYQNLMPSVVTCDQGLEVNIPTIIDYSKKGYTFTGWITNSLDETELEPTYSITKDETTYKPTKEDEKFYAVYCHTSTSEKHTGGFKISAELNGTTYYAGPWNTGYYFEALMANEGGESDATVFFLDDENYLYFYYNGDINYVYTRSSDGSLAISTDKSYANTWSWVSEIAPDEKTSIVGLKSSVKDNKNYDRYILLNNTQIRFATYKYTTTNCEFTTTKTDADYTVDTKYYTTTIGTVGVTGLEIDNPKTTYDVGEQFSTEGVTVYAVYEDGGKAPVQDYDYSPKDAFTEDQIGEQTITFTYPKNSSNPITGTTVVTVRPQQTYTVTLNSCGDTKTTQTLTETSYKSGVTLPSAESGVTGWTFYGWATEPYTPQSKVVPTTVFKKDEIYYPTNDIELFAVYTTTTYKIYDYVYNFETDPVTNWVRAGVSRINDKEAAEEGSYYGIFTDKDTKYITFHCSEQQEDGEQKLLGKVTITLYGKLIKKGATSLVIDKHPYLGDNWKNVDTWDISKLTVGEWTEYTKTTEFDDQEVRFQLESDNVNSFAIDNIKIHEETPTVWYASYPGEVEKYIEFDEAATEIVDVEDTYDHVKVIRTMTANNWSTFCLPFAMSEAQVLKNFGDDVEIMELISMKVEDNTYKLHFANVSEMVVEACKPYMIRPKQTIEGIEVYGSISVNTKGEPLVEVTDADCTMSFIGTYVKMPIEADKGNFYISKNLFYYAKNAVNTKGFRAYLHGVDSEGNYIKSLEFGTDETEQTDNINIVLDDVEDVPVYSVSGQLIGHRGLSGLPKGLYIMGGKKYMLK